MLMLSASRINAYSIDIINYLQVFMSSIDTTSVQEFIKTLQGLEFDRFHIQLRILLAEFMGLRTQDSILDIGCGIPHDLPQIMSAIGPNGRYLGIDILEQLQKLNKEKFDYSNAIFELCPAHLLNVSTQFDLIRAVLVLQHDESYLETLLNCRNLLAKNGKIVIVEHLWQDLRFTPDPENFCALPKKNLGVNSRNKFLGTRLKPELLDQGWDVTSAKVIWRTLFDLKEVKKFLHLEQRCDEYSRNVSSQELERMLNWLNALNTANKLNTLKVEVPYLVLVATE
jgi:SAM-dependent methyltransferase